MAYFQCLASKNILKVDTVYDIKCFREQLMDYQEVNAEGKPLNPDHPDNQVAPQEPSLNKNKKTQ